MQQGSLEFSGHDVRSLQVRWYRDQIGYVGQEPTLFNDTIGNNISYGAPSATQAQVEEAAKMANAHEFIMSFPEGYNTQLGEHTQLSGGQKQRGVYVCSKLLPLCRCARFSHHLFQFPVCIVAIARALIKVSTLQQRN